jgi:hypothetical protein
MRMEDGTIENTEKVKSKQKDLRLGFRFGIKGNNICVRAPLAICNAQV